MTHDGLGKYLKQKITKAPGETADIVGILQDTQTDVARLLPAGRLRAGDQVVRRAGPRGRRRLRQLPAGVHRPRGLLGQALRARPACRSSATTSSPRSARRSSTASSRACSPTAACAWSAPASSTSAATWTSTTCSSASGWSPRRSRRPTPSPRSWTTSCRAEDVYIGPSDYVPWLTDRKWAHIRVEGRSFGDVPLNLELKLEVWDSPNSAGIVIDAVRIDQAGAQQRHRRASSTARPAT